MLKDRFRKYLPVVVDLETGGFDPLKNAILKLLLLLLKKKMSS
jgi:ribonuclease T